MKDIQLGLLLGAVLSAGIIPFIFWERSVMSERSRLADEVQMLEGRIAVMGEDVDAAIGLGNAMTCVWWPPVALVREPSGEWRRLMPDEVATW